GTQFKKFVKPFNAHGYQVVSFDAIGHGRSAGRQSNILYFIKTIEQLSRQFNFAGVVGHSIGGATAIHALINRRFTDKLILIGSPATSENVYGPFLRALQASQSTLNFFLTYTEQKFGRSFASFAIENVISQLDQVDLLIIHDHEDLDVSIDNAHLIFKLYDHAELITTRGLGHTRILKDKQVIQHCLNFIQNSKINEPKKSSKTANINN
ncbi:MAG: alpha/beta fold hydrolase, partial [Fulvivirga sp.]|nr:alpha/beta fold hydrolase [Fulvivirga sp.]